LNILKERIACQRQRKANLSSKENSYDSSEIEKKLDISNTDANISRRPARHRESKSINCQELQEKGCHEQTSNCNVHATLVEQPTAKMNSTFSLMDEVTKPVPLVSHVHHQNSDPVVLKCETRAFSIDDQIPQKAIPRKVASGSGVEAS